MRLIQKCSLLLLYGIISPYCAIALGFNIVAQIYTIKMSLVRYYRLQLSELSGESFDKLERNHHHIDLICENVQSNISSMLWPGVTVTGLIMGLTLFDMAYDTDDDTSSSTSSIAVPLTLLLLPVVSIISMMFVYYRATRKAREDLQSRLASLETSSEIVLTPIAQHHQHDHIVNDTDKESNRN